MEPAVPEVDESQEDEYADLPLISDEDSGTPDDCEPDTDDPETLASKDYHSEWRNIAEEIFRQINDSGK